MRAYLRLARPRQWIKNGLVAGAPLAAGVITERVQLGRVAVAFVALCLASSGTYCLNDSFDVEADRQHPVKRNRPVASGEVSLGAARVVGVTLVVTSVLAALLLGNWHLSFVVLSYVLLTSLYTVWLKDVAILDIAAVAEASFFEPSPELLRPMSRSPSGFSS